MLNKYSMFMMVVLVAASLVGMSTLYQPANVETQSQPQQLVPPGQIQKQPPIVQQQQPAQTQGNPQTTTGNIITRQRQEDIAQTMADKALLDRLFPQIIKRIDGASLLQKIDAKTLAAKVLPFLDLKVVSIERPGPTHNIDVTGIAEKRTIAKASCVPEESLIGGGFWVTGFDRAAPINSHKESFFSPDTKTWVVSPDTKTWAAETVFDHDGSITTYAECLQVELALKQ